MILFSQKPSRYFVMIRHLILFTLFHLVLLGVSALNNDIFNELEPSSHFRSSPKNILFAVTVGGSSHHSWVMRVLDELDRRGHNITYATTVNDLPTSAIMKTNTSCRMTVYDSADNESISRQYLLDHPNCMILV